MTFGERLKECRKDKKLTRTALAKITGICVRSIENYEDDINDPSLFKISCIATALGVSIDYLAGLTDVK